MTEARAHQLIGRQVVQIEELRDTLGLVLTALRRAQDGEFEAVVVDIDRLSWNCTERPKVEQTAATNTDTNGAQP